jgi:hypothetical protein
LLLLEKLAFLAGEPSRDDEMSLAAEAARMAADPEIQREIAAIDREFRCAEMDGLSAK